MSPVALPYDNIYLASTSGGTAGSSRVLKSINTFTVTARSLSPARQIPLSFRTWTSPVIRTPAREHLTTPTSSTLIQRIQRIPCECSTLVRLQCRESPRDEEHSESVDRGTSSCISCKLCLTRVVWNLALLAQMDDHHCTGGSRRGHPRYAHSGRGQKDVCMPIASGYLYMMVLVPIPDLASACPRATARRSRSRRLPATLEVKLLRGYRTYGASHSLIDHSNLSACS